MDEIHFVAEGGQIVCLLAGGIASAHHGHVESFVEIAVAGGAGTHSLTIEFLLAVKTKPTGRGPCGNDDGLGLNHIVVVIDTTERTLTEVCADDISLTDVGAETLSLFLEVGHHVGAGDTLGVAGEILNLGGDGELATGLHALVKDRMDVGAAGIDACGITGGAGAND